MNPERTTDLPQRVHAAIDRRMQIGGNAWDITEAACAEIATYLREEQALWRARQGGRTLNGGDYQFDSAVTQCADDIDPEVWRYLRRV